MPFITKEKRLLVDKDVRLAEAPGELTYFFYKKFIIAWAEKERWTTAHNLYKKYLVQLDHLVELKGVKFTNHDILTALHLAWQVFFIEKVMRYEKRKQWENGDI